MTSGSGVNGRYIGYLGEEEEEGEGEKPGVVIVALSVPNGSRTGSAIPVRKAATLIVVDESSLPTGWGQFPGLSIARLMFTCSGGSAIFVSHREYSRY